jgi:hypothetical protein
MKKIAIIGTGPAAMMAALAAHQEGYGHIHFYTSHGAQLKSVIHGAQYVHGIIHDLPTWIHPFNVRYRYIGTEEIYRRGIYGDNLAPGGTSWGKFGPIEAAWPMREIYDWAFEELAVESLTIRRDLCPDEIEQMVDYYDYVFNTAPLKAIARHGDFHHETVFIAPTNRYEIPRDEIHYFGDGRIAYRASNLMGSPSTEFPFRQRDYIERKTRKLLVEIQKPLSCSNVDLPGMYRLGRYGKWHKGVLTHHVYEEVRHILQSNLPWISTLPA